MKLRFLGAEYVRQSFNVHSQEGPVLGKYRGVPCYEKHYTMPVAPGQDVTLHFLGRPYQAQV